MSARGPAVPVVMYHSVGLVMNDWYWSNLTIPYQTFADHLRWLQAAGYRSATLAELHAHVNGGPELPARTVVLTFDDGYADNWTFATPLLEKYGFTGTVMVTPGFIETRDDVRPTLADVWSGSANLDDLEARGFMSWEELRRVSQTGTLEVQCHAMTHTWYPVSDAVVDFHHPGDNHYWLDWNAYPEHKPNYLRELGTSRVGWGTPVYQHAKSLESRRWFPAAGEAQALSAYVSEHEGESFFERNDWRATLFKILEQWRGESDRPGRMETDEERAARIQSELVDSKTLIEEKLGRSVEHLVWPGGGYDDQAMAAATRIYKSVTIRASERRRSRNRPGDDPTLISRSGAPLIAVRGTDVYADGRYFIHFLDEYRSVAGARRKRQLIKLGCLVAGALGWWPRHR